MRNVIITGIPRSGTTLFSALFDSLQNSVCLSEPTWHLGMAKQINHPVDMIKKLKLDYKNVRKKIGNNEKIMDRRNSTGESVTNYFQRYKGKVKNNYELMPITFNVENEDFLLAMKHCSLYTSILPNIVSANEFTVFSIIRHPIPTILSWNSLSLPISRGIVPDGEHFWPELKKINTSKESILKKQVDFYELFLKRYDFFKDKIYLLRYEKLIEDQTRLERLSQKTFEKKIQIKNDNHKPYYNKDLIKPLQDIIIKKAPLIQQYYDLDNFN